MSEESRFFVRTALYVGPIAVVYWIVSAEIAGTFLLAFVFVGAIVFAGSVLLFVRAARLSAADREHGLAHLVRTTLGFEQPRGRTSAPIDIEGDPIPTSSLWPIAGAAAMFLVALGLVFGPWLWIPGVAAGLSVTWGWATQIGNSSSGN